MLWHKLRVNFPGSENSSGKKNVFGSQNDFHARLMKMQNSIFMPNLTYEKFFMKSTGEKISP
jgi:hypothetical protein